MIKNTYDMVYIAMAVALLTICSWICIPLAVPVTLQTFAVFTVLLTLGAKRGTLATIVYVIMGAVGLPVFSGVTGGLGVLLGRTGGYIIGFLVIGINYCVFTKLFGETPLVKTVSLAIGLLLCYAFGTAWFMAIYMQNTGPVGILTVLGWCVFPFVIPDIAKLALAIAISKRVKSVITRYESVPIDTNR